MPPRGRRRPRRQPAPAHRHRRRQGREDAGDTIKRATQRGTGEIEGVNYEEITFEGYGPGGVAIIVETLTDNRNRTVSEIRHAFSKHGGNLGNTGSVLHMFSKKGAAACSITAINGNKVGFVVDSVIGEHQTVIKSLGPMYRDVQGLSGATILGDGSVALILDLGLLYKAVEALDSNTGGVP